MEFTDEEIENNAESIIKTDSDLKNIISNPSQVIVLLNALNSDKEVVTVDGKTVDLVKPATPPINENIVNINK